jgi:hypothetical protein
MTKKEIIKALNDKYKSSAKTEDKRRKTPKVIVLRPPFIQNGGFLLTDQSNIL